VDSVLEQARHWARKFDAHGSRLQAPIDAGKEGPSLIPALLEILTGRSEYGHPYSSHSRRGAVFALRNIGSPSIVLHTLMSLLGDADGTIRMEAVTGLGDMGPEAIPASERLVELMLDPSPLLREESVQAAWALGLIGGPVAVRALSNEVAGVHRLCRLVAAESLRKLR